MSTNRVKPELRAAEPVVSEAIQFEVDGNKLSGQIYKSEKSKLDLAMMFLHGFDGSQNTSAAQYLAKNGLYTMTFAMRGHSGSDGNINTISRADSLNDALAAYDLFKSRLPKDIKIVVSGSSYGGYITALLSQQRELDGISLRVPANYPEEGFNEPSIGQRHDIPGVMDWRRKKLDPEATKALQALHSFNGNIQIIEAENDEFVPHETVQNYVDAAGNKKSLEYHFMKGWTHSLGADELRNKQFQELLLNWAKRIAKKI